MSSVMRSGCRLVLAHGAGSSSDFLVRAFPADQVGVAEVRFVEDRTGRVTEVMNGLARAATPDRATILGGVSLGAHAALRLLARPDLPQHVVAGVAIMPAWTGAPGRVAGMTGAAADALDVLGSHGVIAELDPGDWVTPLLAEAWAQRTPARLVAELRAAAVSVAPAETELTGVRVPVAVVALRDDPLHPVPVARRWAEHIPQAALVELERSGPAGDLTMFGRSAGRLLAELLTG